MVRIPTTLLGVLLACLSGQAQPGLPGTDDSQAAGSDEDTDGATDAGLGPFSVGVTGIREDARLNTVSGNVELGYLYEHTFDATFPRVLELRPFLFNRASTTETSYYESLGVGAGLGLSLRKQYEPNNWFVRVSMLTPTDHYRAQLDLNRDQTAIFDLFAGYEIPLNVTERGRAMRERTTPPRPIELRVPARLLRADHGVEPETLARIHTLMIEAYLAEAARWQGDPPRPPRQARARWPVIRLIGRVTGQPLTEARWRGLTDDAATDDVAQRTERRREIVSSFVKQGLTRMMRERYPLVIRPAERAPGEGVASGGSARVVGIVSRPGTRVQPSDRPMDADTMIEHYIASLLSRIE